MLPLDVPKSELCQVLLSAAEARRLEGGCHAEDRLLRERVHPSAFS